MLLRWVCGSVFQRLSFLCFCYPVFRSFAQYHVTTNVVSDLAIHSQLQYVMLFSSTRLVVLNVTLADSNTFEV